MAAALLKIANGEEYIIRQLKKHLTLLFDLSADDETVLNTVLKPVLKRVETCWSVIANKYYKDGETSALNFDHSNQHCQFLLILASALSMNDEKALADKVFALNKMMHSCDIYHETPLPDCFYIDHTLGMVIGRAQLGERLMLSQNCTIGGNPGAEHYPVLGRDNYLMSNVSVIGTVTTGDRVIFAAGTYVNNINIPSDSIVFGRSPDLIIKPMKNDLLQRSTPFYL